MPTNPTTIQYTTTSLFGGAISADLPTGYLDASSVRPVPDNQEVWTSPHNHAGPNVPISIIFDICEMIPEEETALETHFQDIMESGDEVQTSDREHGVVFKALDRKGGEVVARVGKRGGSVIQVGLLLLRLKEKKTDFLVSVIVDSRDGHDVGARIRGRIRESLRILDWELFVNDEDMDDGVLEEPQS